jgi:hypothetical protein
MDTKNSLISGQVEEMSILIHEISKTSSINNYGFYVKNVLSKGK